MSSIRRTGRPRTHVRTRLNAFGAALAAALALACSAPPVDWAAERSIAPPVDAPLALTADGVLHADTVSALAPRVAPPPGPVCPGSLRLARGGATLFAVWWAPRSDSGARLLAARSADEGRSWSTPASVDTTDRAVTGCRREPAAIAADAASGYVHVTYGLQAPEGPGLFFSHSMDGGMTFHAPVPILYGDRLGRTSVAADGDLVVVAFEDPNSTMPRIGLAMSRTMGHIFEERIVPVSDDNGAATRPLVAVRGRRVAVAWEQRAETAAAPAAAGPRFAVRAGTVR
jgi:hypothetical protein